MKIRLEELYLRKIDRRNFLKKTGQAALAVSGGLTLETVLSCAHIRFKEESPVIYPPLKGHKVQPPENGCYIGFYPFDEYDRDYYNGKIGKGPKIMIPPVGKFRNHLYLPETIVEAISSKGAIPFVYKDIGGFIRLFGFKNLIGNEKFTENLKEFAKGIVSFGKPIFISTIREMNSPNAYIRPWKGKTSKNVKEVWKYMWQIFEDTGANEYATWVWEVIPPESHALGNMRNPEPFYPGDKYVDWIGLAVYSARWNDYRSFSSLAGSTYRQMRINHPEKPIMMAEFGANKDNTQARWLKKAFEKIKIWPGMKAAICWDNDNPQARSRHTLTDKSFEVYREIMKDPYFIWAGPR